MKQDIGYVWARSLGASEVPDKYFFIDVFIYSCGSLTGDDIVLTQCLPLRDIHHLSTTKRYVFTTNTLAVKCT